MACRVCGEIGYGDDGWCPMCGHENLKDMPQGLIVAKAALWRAGADRRRLRSARD